MVGFLFVCCLFVSWKEECKSRTTFKGLLSLWISVLLSVWKFPRNIVSSVWHYSSQSRNWISVLYPKVWWFSGGGVLHAHLLLNSILNFRLWNTSNEYLFCQKWSFQCCRTNIFCVPDSWSYLWFIHVWNVYRHKVENYTFSFLNYSYTDWCCTVRCLLLTWNDLSFLLCWKSWWHVDLKWFKSTCFAFLNF